MKINVYFLFIDSYDTNEEKACGSLEMIQIRCLYYSMESYKRKAAECVQQLFILFSLTVTMFSQ